jgi:hypothetical protein
MGAVTITLTGAAVAKALKPLAYTYAYRSVERVATVRHAPKADPKHEAEWRALRDTLRSVCPDLPDVGEPVWPSLYNLDEDYVTTHKGKVVNVGGIAMRVGSKQERKKSAKPKPTYSRHLTSSHAEAWAEAFVARFTS